MDINNPKWFRSLGAEKLMEAEEREREVKDMAEIKEATVLEAVPSNTVVLDKCTGEKMILHSFTNHAILAGKDGEIRVRDIQDIKILLTDEQKRLLE